MKKIILFLCLALYFISVSAHEDIDVSLSRERVKVGEMFEISVRINTSEIRPDAVEFEIPGIENFQVFSQSQSQQYKSINGEVDSTMNYILQVQAQSEGSFTLGPVKLQSRSGEVLDDMKLTIEVGKGGSSTQNQVQNPIATEEDGENTEDTNTAEYFSDLEGLRGPVFPSGVLLLLVLVFLIIFYWVLQKYFGKQESMPNETILVTPQKNMYHKWRAYLENLESQKNNMSSQEFSQKLSQLYREILLFEGVSISKTATLKELKQNKKFQSHPLKDGFEKNYFGAFHTQGVYDEQITELKNYLLSQENPF